MPHPLHPYPLKLQDRLHSNNLKDCFFPYNFYLHSTCCPLCTSTNTATSLSWSLSSSSHAWSSELQSAFATDSNGLRAGSSSWYFLLFVLLERYASSWHMVARLKGWSKRRLFSTPLELHHFYWRFWEYYPDCKSNIIDTLVRTSSATLNQVGMLRVKVVCLDPVLTRHGDSVDWINASMQNPKINSKLFRILQVSLFPH